MTSTDPYALDDVMVAEIAELAAQYQKRLVTTYDITTGRPIYQLCPLEGEDPA
jgi:hypothetical protein